jgi:hypothetical protein
VFYIREIKYHALRPGFIDGVHLHADGILKVTPLANAVPEEAETLMRQAYSLLPHVKVTDLLLEVDRWIRFTDDFTHLKSQEPAKDQPF